jgi:hypothetical protein
MKYKLIKEYPGSPKLNTEVIYSEKHKIYNYNFGTIYTEFPKNQVENLPEFWELVIEKDFEILEFTSKNSGDKAIRNIKGSFNTSNIYNLSEKELLADNRSIITKVKRLSDNEIFTIGDYVKVNITITQDTIKEFNVLLNNLCVSLNHQFDSSYYGKKGCNITVINKIKPVLFTTEDGVDIYEGDVLWFIDDDDWSINERITKKGDTYKNRGMFPFSTKEKAEAYLTFNKPSLSLTDTLSVISKIDYITLKDLYSLTVKFAELVKNK